MVFLCIDVGATKTLVATGEEDFEELHRFDSKDFLENISSKIYSKFPAETISKIDTVAVGVAGVIDEENTSFTPQNISLGKVDLSVLEEFGELHIYNDGSAAAIGEFQSQEGNANPFVYITFSSGIGAGVVINGELVEGWEGNFGEVGCMTLRENGPECGCGDKGHWEAFCSGEGLKCMAEDMTGERFEETRSIFEKFYEGYDPAIEVIDKMQDLNTDAFSNIILLYNPEEIVVGGSVAKNHPEVVVNPLREELEDATINEAPEIELSTLENPELEGLKSICRASGD